MKTKNEKLPSPAELEKELGNFLAEKFGGNVKVISPISFPEQKPDGDSKTKIKKKKEFQFDLKPEELISYLDQYVIKQDEAKAALSTKICTHFNRIKYRQKDPDIDTSYVGQIKNNVLMIGPTGVGKTYIIKLIAKKIGVPFVKGDATKFSETGYVGGDVEDLIRDLVKDAGDDIELAQYGIVYIDEIDKIASSRNFIGADVSRTGVQRALLKPMEETEVDLKVPYDPISILQELERFKKTGAKKRQTVNTKNILFIMSGAFSDLTDIIKKRLTSQPIGFGSNIRTEQEKEKILKKVKSEDLIEFGFETEFVGRLPVRAVFEKLEKEDLFTILKNPNNPIILGKKVDFAAYGIDIKFTEESLRLLSEKAYQENTGARGLVSAVEKALLIFEKKLPSTDIKELPVTEKLINDQQKVLDDILAGINKEEKDAIFKELCTKERNFIVQYIKDNIKALSEKHKVTLTIPRIRMAADYYIKYLTDTGSAIEKIKSYYESIKNLEVLFYRDQGLNIVFKEDAVNYIIKKFIFQESSIEKLYKQLTEDDFKLGLNLVQEKTGIDRFFLTKEAFISPEEYISSIIKENIKENLEEIDIIEENSDQDLEGEIK